MIKYLGILFILFHVLHGQDKEEDNPRLKLQPPDLSFEKLEDSITAYLATVPEDRKKIEGRRLGIVKNFKKMVQKVLSRNTYEGKIFLKTKVFMGKILEAKDDELVIADSKNQTMSVKWEDLHMRQYSEIFIAEAVNKAKNLTANKRSKDSEDAFKKAGNYYFALAVFYDWYGNAAAAKIYRQKALTLNPDKKEEISQLWPEPLKN